MSRLCIDVPRVTSCAARDIFLHYPPQRPNACMRCEGSASALVCGEGVRPTCGGNPEPGNESEQLAAKPPRASARRASCSDGKHLLHNSLWHGGKAFSDSKALGPTCSHPNPNRHPTELRYLPPHPERIVGDTAGAGVLPGRLTQSGAWGARQKMAAASPRANHGGERRALDEFWPLRP